MEFTSLTGGVVAVQLEQVEDERFRLIQGIRFRRPATNDIWDVTETNLGLTNLATIPWFLRWFVVPYGKHTLAAILHDFLVDEAHVRRKMPPEAYGTPLPDRPAADDIFLEMLEDLSVPWVQRSLMWSAVTFQTRRSGAAGNSARLATWIWLVFALAGTAAVVAYAPLLHKAFFEDWGNSLPWYDSPARWYLWLAGLLGPLLAAPLWAPKYAAGIWFGLGILVLLPPAVAVVLGRTFLRSVVTPVLGYFRGLLARTLGWTIRP